MRGGTAVEQISMPSFQANGKHLTSGITVSTVNEVRHDDMQVFITYPEQHVSDHLFAGAWGWETESGLKTKSKTIGQSPTHSHLLYRWKYVLYFPGVHNI